MATCDRFSIALDVVIRPCRAEDLPALEWFGLFAPHRALIHRVFEQHRRGEAVMLVAQVGREPSGQLWIDLQRHAGERMGEIWAVRVLPCLQGQGIGERMIRASERLLLARGLRGACMSVDIDNLGARRLYERLGYAVTGTLVAEHPPEAPRQRRSTQWQLSRTFQQALSAQSMPQQG